MAAMSSWHILAFRASEWDAKGSRPDPKEEHGNINVKGADKAVLLVAACFVGYMLNTVSFGVDVYSVGYFMCYGIVHV
jgi:hypothetical protein